MQYNETVPFVAADAFAGRRVAFLVAHCFEEVELTVPLRYLRRGGALVDVLTPDWLGSPVASCEYCRAMNWFTATGNFSSALAAAAALDAVVIPGGLWSSQVVANDNVAQKLVRTALAGGQTLVATVCSGASMLLRTDLPADTAVTGSPAVRTELSQRFQYVDEPVVPSTENLLTGRSPQNQDSQLFAKAIGEWLQSRR